MTPTLPKLAPIARPGDPVSAIDTPALVLELDAFERNLDRMQALADAAGVALRPHAKAHKCPAVAHAQIRRGAVGICCQKVSEALPFLEAGITDIHISNQLASAAKAALLAQMALHGRLSVCVDHTAQIAALAEATEREGSRLGVFIEVNIGQDRCGVADAPAALRLLESLAKHPRLTFSGIQAYHGGIQHLRGREERSDATARAAERAAAFIAELAKAGVTCPTVTGGGSGSVAFDLASGIFTEVQPGSYVFMDGDYGRNEPSAELHFEHSLFIASTVMSVGDGSRLIVDAGLKSLAVDSGLPTIWDGLAASASLAYVAANDEHGIVDSRGAEAARPVLGSQLLLVPGHCDPTLNLHDEIVAVRGGLVEAVYAIAARGLSR